MAHENAEKKNKSSSQDFMPWKLIPIDSESSPEENAGSPRAHSSYPIPGPSVSIENPEIVVNSIPVTFSDTSYTELKSVLSKIRCNEKTISSAEGVSNQLVSPSPILESTSSMSSLSTVHNAVVDQLENSSQNVKNSSKHKASLENESNPLVPPKPAGPISPMKAPSPIQKTAKKQAEQSSQNSQSGLKIKAEDQTTKFINLVREFPHLYSSKASSDRDMKRNDKSWTVISEVLDMTVDDCLTTWQTLRVKNRRKKRELADGGRVSEKTLQFLNSMSFLPPEEKSSGKRRNAPEDYTLPASSPKKRKKTSKSSSRSSPENTSSESKLSCSTSKTVTSTEKETNNRVESPSADKLFTDNIALELKRVSSQQKHIIKAKIWQVFAEFANPV